MKLVEEGWAEGSGVGNLEGGVAWRGDVPVRKNCRFPLGWPLRGVMEETHNVI